MILRQKVVGGEEVKGRESFGKLIIKIMVKRYFNL